MSSSSVIQHFMVDPPWPQRKGGKRKVRRNQQRELDYSTLPIPDIFELLDKDVLTRAACDHNVFLWGIDKYLCDGEFEMRRRGYKLHARLIWDKGNGVAPAFTVRYSHEYLSWFYRDKLLPVANATRGKVTTVMREAGRQHSRKPQCAYDLIDLWYPNSTKMDVFSREPRAGWEQYGDQTTLFSTQQQTPYE